MGLFDLFKKKKEGTPAPQPKRVLESEAYWEFYNRHEKKLDKWEERIEDTIDYNDNPEKNN